MADVNDDVAYEYQAGSDNSKPKSLLKRLDRVSLSSLGRLNPVVPTYGGKRRENRK